MILRTEYPEYISWGGWELRPESQELCLIQSFHLTPAETEILAQLLLASGRVVRAEAFGRARDTLAVLIAKIRTKIPDIEIHAISKVGYQLRVHK